MSAIGVTKTDVSFRTQTGSVYLSADFMTGERAK